MNELRQVYDRVLGTEYAQKWAKTLFNDSDVCQLVKDFDEKVPDFLALNPQTKKALDIGAGIGENAVYLARRGINVTALEPAASGIEKIAAYAREHALPITPVQGGIQDFSTADTYDMIMSINVLMHLRLDDLNKALTKMSDLTKPNGYNLIRICCSDSSDFQASNVLTTAHLPGFYRGWNLLKNTSRPGRPTLEHLEDGIQVQYLVQDIIAQKK